MILNRLLDNKIPKLRWCKRCKTLKTIYDFDRRKDKFVDVCHSCKNLKPDNIKGITPDAIIDEHTEYDLNQFRKCSKCGEIKTFGDFRIHRNKPDVFCKECKNEIDRDRTKNRTPEQIEKDRQQDKLARENKKKKAKVLNIIPFNFECSEQEGLACKCCGKFFPHHCFKIDTRFKRGYSKKCISCLGDVTQNIKKACSKCGEEKYLHQFRKNCVSKDGRTSNCCECGAEKERELHKIPEIRERNRQKCSVYGVKHRDYDLQRKRNYKEENEEELKEASRIYHIENAKIIKERQNTPEAKHKKYERKKVRLQTDEQFRITDTLRTRMRIAFNEQDTRKNKSSKEYGIDWDDIAKYLKEIKPEEIEGVKLSIDHIVPCKSFNLLDDEHVRKCYVKENLRWCSINENSAKNNFIIPNLIRKHNLVWLTDWLNINLEEHEKENVRISKYNKQEE